ncbi:MAG: AbiV family abortive infection protein [Gammaproteobacteria bacterium]|nr:AbiV family abortive infection protein [Gammaproteobacteria bacterium]
MKPSILELNRLLDDTLFEEISQGVAHIIENAESLESMAVRLIELGEYRGAKMFRALAAEESAKVLILVDVVRCPLEESDKRIGTLRRFYSHLPKHIHARACQWRTADFAELKRAIHRERRTLYLDGPNEVDWIFQNYASTERERPMYVDYVKDITEDDGDCWWLSPLSERKYWESESATPTSLITARALDGMGLTTPEGLSIVADEWRPFKPEPETSYFFDLSPRIKQTLLRVMHEGLCPEMQSHYYWTVIDHWPFPLWSLDLTPLKITVEELRGERKEGIEVIKILEAQREPPPRISRDTLEALDKAYAEWRCDEDQLISRYASSSGDTRLVVLTGSLGREIASLESNKKLKDMVFTLTPEERMDLITLGWFGRDPQSGWEHCYHRARMVGLDDSIDYICGLGRYWLKGFERWKSEPELPASLRSGGQTV